MASSLVSHLVWRAVPPSMDSELTSARSGVRRGANWLESWWVVTVWWKGAGGWLIAFIIGSQQYTARGLAFTNCVTAVEGIWDWGWTWQDVRFPPSPWQSQNTN